MNALIADFTCVLGADGKALFWTHKAFFTTVLEHDGALSGIGGLVGPPSGDARLGFSLWGLPPGLR